MMAAAEGRGERKGGGHKVDADGCGRVQQIIFFPGWQNSATVCCGIDVI